MELCKQSGPQPGNSIGELGDPEVLQKPVEYWANRDGWQLSVIYESTSGSTVCRLIRHNGYTRKKIRQVAIQQSEILRGIFMSRVLHYLREFFVRVGECGSDNRDQIWLFDSPVYRRFLVRGTRTSSVVAMSSSVVLDLV